MTQKDKLNTIIQVILSTLSPICIWVSWFTKPTDLEFFNLTPGSLFLCGVFCSLLFVVSVLDKTLKPILDIFLIKTIIFGSLTSFIIICTSQASTLLNKIYSTDTDMFIYSKIFITGILMFKKAAPFLVFIFFPMMIFYFCLFIGSTKKLFDGGTRDCIKFCDSIKYFLFLVTTSTCLYFTYQFNWKYFSEKILDEKAYIIANSLDFYPNTICKLNNFFEDARILYLDSSHKNILVDNNPPEEKDIWETLTTYTEGKFTRISSRDSNFHIVECIPRKNLIEPQKTIPLHGGGLLRLE